MVQMAAEVPGQAPAACANALEQACISGQRDTASQREREQDMGSGASPRQHQEHMGRACPRFRWTLTPPAPHARCDSMHSRELVVMATGQHSRLFPMCCMLPDGCKRSSHVPQPQSTCCAVVMHQQVDAFRWAEHAPGLLQLGLSLRRTQQRKHLCRAATPQGLCLGGCPSPWALEKFPVMASGTN